jgi:hypothetical protein
MALPAGRIRSDNRNPLRREYDLITLDNTVQERIACAQLLEKAKRRKTNTMRVSHCTLTMASLLLLAAPAFAMVGPKKTSPRMHAHVSLKHALSTRRGSHSAIHHRSTRHEYAMVGMPTERAMQIQAALIKQGYLAGDPTGTWDAQSVAAMQKLQGDNGWQTKVTPDSRALIKLGLGPQAPGTGPDQPQ